MIMFEGGILSPRCRSGAYAARPSGRRPLRRLAALAGLGPSKALRLQVLRDRLTTPKGESLVRVIQASLHDHKVTVTAGSQVLARQLPFGNVTSYATARPGTWMVHVSGAAGMATK